MPHVYKYEICVLGFLIFLPINADGMVHTNFICVQFTYIYMQYYYYVYPTIK